MQIWITKSELGLGILFLIEKNLKNALFQLWKREEIPLIVTV